MTDCVIDASSILVFIFDEPGAGIVGDAARTGRLLVSTVNLAEVFAKLADKGIGLDLAKELVAPLDLDPVPFDHGQALASASLRPQTRRGDISLGDRCCIALGTTTGLPILTADRTWRMIADAIGVDLVITRPDPV